MLLKKIYFFILDKSNKLDYNSFSIKQILKKAFKINGLQNNLVKFFNKFNKIIT